MNIPELDLKRVVIIGGGFAGLNLAKKLDKKAYQVVLLDKNNYHTFQPLLYQVATSGLEPDSIGYPIRKTFKASKNFHFRWVEVTKIDTSSKIVYTNCGDLKYDKLVIATGAVTNFFNMDDVAQKAIPMKSLVESLDLRSKILQNFEQALYVNDLKEQERLMNFIIVGGGPTGVELAGALAELKKHVLANDYPDLDIRRMNIHLIEAAPRVLAPMSENASKKAHNFLKKLGVNVWTNMQVKHFDGKLVTTNSDKTFSCETLIWAAGVKGDPINGIDASNIKNNRIIVNEFNRIETQDDVYAIGDIAFQTSKDYPKGYPMLGSVAMQQGIHLGKNLNRLLKGKNMNAFKYLDKGTMATVGRNLAVVDLPKFKFQGFFAWFVWMFVHLMLLVGFRNKLVVFINWAWSYIWFDKGTRLIVRPFKKNSK